MHQVCNRQVALRVYIAKETQDAPKIVGVALTSTTRDNIDCLVRKQWDYQSCHEWPPFCFTVGHMSSV